MSFATFKKKINCFKDYVISVSVVCVEYYVGRMRTFLLAIQKRVFIYIFDSISRHFLAVFSGISPDLINIAF